VKAANTHLSSVTEIGAIIGSLWRELGSEEKLQYNEQFSKDKVKAESSQSLAEMVLNISTCSHRTKFF